MAEGLSENGAETYMYYWSYPSAIKNYGACHAIELSSVFNNPEVTLTTGGKYNEELAQAVRSMWVSFAKTGNPTVEDIQWPVYDAEARYTMNFDEAIEVTGEPLSERRQLITPLLKYNFNGNYTNISYAVPHIFKLVAIAVVIVIIIVLLIIFIIRKIRAKRR